MHIPIMAAIQGFSLLSQALHLDGRSPAATANQGAKPGGSCISRGEGTDFSSAMQLQDLMKSVGERLSAAERQQVGLMMNDGNVQQALHLLKQFSNVHAGSTFNAPGASPVFTYAPTKPL